MNPQNQIELRRKEVYEFAVPQLYDNKTTFKGELLQINIHCSTGPCDARGTLTTVTLELFQPED